MKHVVRTSAKAVIILEGRLLAVKNSSSGTDWYILPGGGQHHGETLVEALKRECMEEISLAVEPDDILFIRDYISANHEFALEDAGAHQVEFMFRCRIPEGMKPETGKTPDPHQTGIEWLPLEKLHEYALYPKQLKEMLKNGIPVMHPVYLGDIN
jgi:8-oxo-dGTP diphosphatase